MRRYKLSCKLGAACPYFAAFNFMKASSFGLRRLAVSPRFYSLAAGIAGVFWIGLRNRKCDLNGRNVLVTEGDRELETALVRRFAEKGACLLYCARSDLKLEEASRDLSDQGVPVTTICCDVSDRKQVEKMLDEAEAALG